MPTPRILAFSGSLRTNSYNTMLLRVAAEGARAAGAEVTLLSLRDYPLPVFDEDLERDQGLHPNARKLKDAFLSHQGLLLATPEYNSTFSAAMKNTIDWVSRPATHPLGRPERGLECFENKVCALLAASPGALGGIRGLPQLRYVLANIKVTVLPDQFSLMKAHEAFDAAGNLKDPKQSESAKGIGAVLAKTLSRLI